LVKDFSLIATALNNSGHQLYCPADFATVILRTKTTLADLFLNCFAVDNNRDVFDTDIDTTALLDIQDVKKSLQGDNDAYKRLVERHQKQISAMMWRFSASARASA
jgi:hypothetical protein